MHGLGLSEAALPKPIPLLRDSMRFTLIDRIVDFQPGASITARKSLTMSEEYLADHFPNFPVMPGVLMLEAMTQAAAWLVRLSEDFAHSLVTLKQAVNVKYSQFVEPGQTLTVAAEILSQTGEETKIKASGSVDGRMIVSARLVSGASTWPTATRTRRLSTRRSSGTCDRRSGCCTNPDWCPKINPEHDGIFMRFDGKTALVTGGSRGIGRACVAQLAAEGATVALVYRSNQAAAEGLIAELGCRQAG